MMGRADDDAASGVTNAGKAGTAESYSDTEFSNCRIVDLFGQKIIDGVVTVRDGIITGVNDGLPAKEKVDCGGMYLAPGLIDAHVHIESSLLTPYEYSRLVLPRGTVAVVADPHEIANVLGYDGMRFMLESAALSAIDIRFTIPSCVPATNLDTPGAILGASELASFLGHSAVVGLGEMMNYPGVLSREPEIMKKLEMYAAAGKRLDGHAPGLRGAPLSAYVSAGIMSDHEACEPDEALEKISKGMRVMMRWGSSARDVLRLLPALTPKTARRFMLCTDDRHADDLVSEGHIDYIVRLLLDNGIDLVTALTVASLNAAEYYGLDRGGTAGGMLGAIAPGYKADFILFDNPTDFTVRKVYRRGKAVAENGILTGKREDQIIHLRDSVNVKLLDQSDFVISCGPGEQNEKVRVIAVTDGSIVTREEMSVPLIIGGKCESDTSRDILKLFVIERHKGSGNIGKGFVTGFGLKRGAIASTISHDSHNIIVVGVDDCSIFRAVKHLNAIRGGIAYAVGDEIAIDMPLPVAGLMSERDAAFVIERLREFDRFFSDLELCLRSPLMTLSFLALPVIPELKLTDCGLVDVRTFTHVPLFVKD